MAQHDHSGGTPNHIDVHHHFYPPEFRQALNDFTGHPMPAVETWTPEASLEEMDTNGVSTAILSLYQKTHHSVSTTRESTNLVQRSQR